MEFKDLLNKYILQLDCTAKTLSEASGLSAATISRYRSVDRIPDPGSDNYLALIRGIAKLASESEKMSLTICPKIRLPWNFPDYWKRILWISTSFSPT